MKEMLGVILDLQGVIPEPCRALVARRLAALVTDKLKLTDQDLYKKWLEKEQFRFFRDCKLSDPMRWVPEDLRIEPSKLSAFCQKWMSVSAFKLPEEDESKYRPITVEMNGLRVSMIKELLSLSETDLKKLKWAGD